MVAYVYNPPVPALNISRIFTTGTLKFSFIQQLKVCDKSRMSMYYLSFIHLHKVSVTILEELAILHYTSLKGTIHSGVCMKSS